MLHDFLANMLPGQIQREATTLLALSTVALADVDPGTMVLAARGRVADDSDDSYLHDLTGVFGAEGGFPFLYARAPCQKVDVAAVAARDHFNAEPEAHGREVNPARHMELVWRQFQSPAGTRVRGGPGQDDRATGWEFAGYVRAWRDRGPVSLCAVVVDTYDQRPPIGPLLEKFGAFIRHLLENFQP